MQITFIRPSMMPGLAGDAMEPLVFALLAGLTPAEVTCRLYDERVEDVPFEEPTDLVAMTVDTFSARRAYQIAGLYKRKGIPVVLGGCHPTLCPDEALRFATSVVLGDAEDLWPGIVQDAKSNTLKRVYQSSFPTLEGLRVNRSLFQKKRYRPLRLVQFGRGCPYACDFCSVHAFYGSTCRQRPVAEVLDEIENQSRRFLFITDDNLFSNRTAAREFLVALKSLKVRWTCQASLDVARDPELLRQMAQSGCVSVIVGFESLHLQNLAQMGKSWNGGQGSYEELIERVHDQGIMIYGTFVFGYDHDTPDSFARSVEFAVRNRLFLANFNPLTPTPGTALYARLKKEGRLIRDPWWLDAAHRYGDSVFHPVGMTADQLTEGCYGARTEFNTFKNILTRAMNRKANSRSLYQSGVYFAANLASRHEIHRKQGRPLGGPDPLDLALDASP